MNEYYQEFINSNTNRIDSIHGYFELFKLLWKVLPVRITSDTTDHFTELFGPAHFNIQDSEERTIQCWKVVIPENLIQDSLAQTEPLVMWILTAPDRGTTYEFQGDMSLDTLKRVFLEYLYVPKNTNEIYAPGVTSLYCSHSQHKGIRDVISSRVAQLICAILNYIKH